MPTTDWGRVSEALDASLDGRPKDGVLEDVAGLQSVANAVAHIGAFSSLHTSFVQPEEIR